jgi:acetyltransferase
MMGARLEPLLAPKRIIYLYQKAAVLPKRPETLRAQVEYVQIDATGQCTLPASRFDLAVIYVHPANILTVLRTVCLAQLARAVVMPGRAAQEVTGAAGLLAAAANILLLGPHAFGLQLPALGMNASVAALAQPGNIALLSQSSSLTGAMLDWAADNHVGFSLAASCGAKGNTSLPNLLNYCATDPHTHAVVVYLDEIAPGHLHTRRFISALRAAASAKPVVVLKPTGRGIAAPVPSNTLAQDEAVFSAALARAGAAQVYKQLN